MDKFVIRRATGADRRVYYDCLRDREWRRLYGMHFADEELEDTVRVFAPLNSRDLLCYICELNDRAVGFINLLFSDPCRAVLSGGLLPRFQASGFGPVLYACMLGHLMRVLPEVTFVTEVEKCNLSSAAMQRFFGFVEEGDSANGSKTVFALTKPQFLEKTANDPLFCEILSRFPCEVYDEC